MKKLIVNFDNYRYNEYPAYFNRGTEIEKPQNPAFEMGEVVVITSEDGLEIGVVIGWIDESYGELRTDMAGMVSMDAIRSATLEDFFTQGIRFLPNLYDDCRRIKS